MQTWSISYTSDRKKLKNRHWLQGKMNFNPSTSTAHFYDEDSVEIGKQKMRGDEVVADAEISLWRHLIEVGQLESTEDECVEEVFDRLNKELGIDAFNNNNNKRQKVIEPPVKAPVACRTIAPLLKTPRIPLRVEPHDPPVLYDILYTRDKGPDRVWQDGLLKFHPSQRLGEFYEGDTGKLVQKKTMGAVREGEIIEEACGGTLAIEICAMRPGNAHNDVIEAKQPDRLFSILYTTDKHKKAKKWLDGLISYSPTTHLAKFLADDTHACFYKKVIVGGVAVGEELMTGMYIVQVDHEIAQDKENNNVMKHTGTNTMNTKDTTIMKANIINTASMNTIAQISKKPVSIVASESVPLEGRSNDEAVCSGHSLKSLPLPLLHHRPSDLILFEASAMLKFILNCATPPNHRLQRACDQIVKYVETKGPLNQFCEEALKLVNELNGNFSTSAGDFEKIVVFSTLKRSQTENSLLSGEINGWMSSFESEISKSDSGLIKSLLVNEICEAGCPVIDEKIIFTNKDGNEKVLPCDDGSTRNVLITSALPYVNNVPHLGNIVGAVLSADVYARYCRRSGFRTLYICGTDEYGTATETKALEEGLSCQAICDKYFKMHASIYDWFQIDFDAFGRSSTPVQTEITHEIFRDLYDNGFFFTQSVDQCYCEKCTRFLADRYVEGTCPHCGFNDARGDQCDGCGKLLNAVELLSPQCKLCRTTPVIRSSNHLFLDLSKLQSECENFVETAAKKSNWSSNSLAIARAWLTEGLRPRCMTRDLKWGTSVPMSGFEDKVFYVWFDAPIGYISITAGYDLGNWRRWWQNEEVELHQFMGKDNVPFHTVIFPSTLLGTRKPWTLLHQLNSTEYLNYEGGKFSKSRGTGIFGSDARDSGIPASIWRYYLLAIRPENTDAAFSWTDFVAKTNSELLANLGNFVNRATRFVSSKFCGLVPAGELSEVDRVFMAEHVLPELVKYRESMEICSLRAALKCAMSVSAAGNLYLAEQKLDNKLLLSNPARCGTVISVALNLCYLLSVLLEPFIPGSAEDILKILRLPARTFPSTTSFELVITPGHRIGHPFHLFTKLDEAAVTELKAKFGGKDASAKMSVTESAAN